MAESPQCPKCLSPLAAGSPAGLCPACLLKRGLEPNTVGFTAESRPQSAQWTPLAPADLAPRFPELDILELIGRGGMGAVYKARQKNLQRVVALKVLPPEIGRDPAFSERFAREAQAMARLNHAHIVAIHDFGHREGLYFFVMEYVDGLNLRQLMSTGAVSAKEALAIVPQICDALQFAHDQGIVHRDIKPENILLDKRGQVKIADFGLAKLMGQQAPGAAGGSTGQPAPTERVMGTPQYMAPEQVEHPKDVDHRADIYSLGVVFYQMLTGELPMGRFEPPSHRVLIDVRLDEVVLKALEKEPDRRYQQASQVKTQVETILTTPLGTVAGASARADQPPVAPGVAAGPSGGGPVAGALPLKPPALPGDRPASGGPISAPRFSRKAIIGAAWAAFFLSLGTLFVGVRMTAGASGPAWWAVLLGVPVMLLGLTSPFVTTILGAIALSQIRHSAGRLTGLGLALFDVLLFPLLALDGLVFWAGDSINLKAAVCVLIALVVDAVIVWLSWRAARKPVGGATAVPAVTGPGAGGPPTFAAVPPKPKRSGLGVAALALGMAGLGLTGVALGCLGHQGGLSWLPILVALPALALITAAFVMGCFARRIAQGKVAIAMACLGLCGVMAVPVFVFMRDWRAHSTPSPQADAFPGRDEDTEVIGVAQFDALNLPRAMTFFKLEDTGDGRSHLKWDQVLIDEKDYEPGMTPEQASAKIGRGDGYVTRDHMVGLRGTVVAPLRWPEITALVPDARQRFGLALRAMTRSDVRRQIEIWTAGDAEAGTILKPGNGYAILAPDGRLFIAWMWMYSPDGKSAIFINQYVGSMQVDRAAASEESSWGQPVEGVQVRLRAVKPQWKPGEIISFESDGRNQGEADFTFSNDDREIRIDGQWYWRQQDPTGRPGQPVSILHPGESIENHQLSLVLGWVQRESPHKPLIITPGKHRIELAWVGKTGKEGHPVVPTSNAVEFEFLAPETRAAQMPWGESVDGVQVRLRVEKNPWRAGEWPSFMADVRNQGSNRYGLWAQGIYDLGLQVDGTWYGADEHTDVPISSATLSPHEGRNDQPVPLWRSGDTQSFWVDDSGKPLVLLPGRHTIRLSAAASKLDSAKADSAAGTPINAISNPVEIEILAAAPVEKPAAAALEFRIAPSAESMDPAELASCRDWLKAGRLGFWWKDGRVAGIAGRLPEHAWLPVADGYPGLAVVDTVIGQYEGKNYLLVSDKPGERMPWSPAGKDAWGLAAVSPGTASDGDTTVVFKLNAAGAAQFGTLTKANLRRHMAIIVNGQVVSAPSLMAVLTDTAIISGLGKQGERDRLIDQLKPLVSPGAAAAKTDKNPAMKDQIEACKNLIATVSVALDVFSLDCGRYPTSKEGLQILFGRSNPAGMDGWRGPYLKGDDVKDPWGHTLLYRCPSERNKDSYDLSSMGPDGREGGGDDIGDWSGPKP
jgi:type II secretion system protein G